MCVPCSVCREDLCDVLKEGMGGPGLEAWE